MTRGALILEGVGEAVGFMATAWARAWGAMVLAGGLFGALWAGGMLTPGSPWRWGSLILVLGAVTIALGALYRLALRQETPGPAGLQWRRAEWRLSAVLVLSLVFLSILGLLAFVVILSFAFAVASAGHGFVTALPMTWGAAVDGRGRAVMTVVWALVLSGMGWAALRLSLAPATSVARERVQVLASWPITRGLVLPILAAQILLGAAPLGLASALLAGLSRSSHPPPLALWSGSLAAGLLVAGGWLPLSAGLMAHLYRRRDVP
jgi:hypothetical protein